MLTIINHIFDNRKNRSHPPYQSNRPPAVSADKAAPDIAGQGIAAAALRPVFSQPDAESAHKMFRQVADQLRPRWTKLADFMETSEHDVLAYMDFPAQHRVKLHSTNPLERLNKEVKRRTDVMADLAAMPDRNDLIAIPTKAA